MVLMKSKENVPKDAVLLTEEDAIKYAWDFVDGWKTPSDVWALRFGPFILGGINAISGLIINNHFRNKLKLGPYGFLSSAIPISLMPGILTPLFHRYIVSTDMLLMKAETCPLCYEIRSTVLQLGLGVVYPMLLAPTTAMMLSHRYATARIPELYDGPRVIVKFVSKLARPLQGTVATLAGLQVVSSALITYFEMRNILSIRREVMEIERKLENEESLRYIGDAPMNFTWTLVFNSAL
ncbi:unnamed protein product [Chilo suppressalis]|uniref:Transmembrane protein 126A n=1 Tax=Chilo suppressalis TaxID=168631 RepID=A0ABN8LC56_CHISP|nr:unnamed protein product [Chilo suppressalis]